tara:strand:- start:222 stop:875 length:654 start_codon:yes stop_codon:yes gene_type:complete
MANEQEQIRKKILEIKKRKAERQRQIDEGYTYYDALMEFHGNPENQTELGLKMNAMVESIKGGFNNLGESLASMLIGQDPETNEIPGPKGDDAINNLIKQSTGNPEADAALQMVLEGIMTGGMGGTLKLGSKAGSSIINKILERNAQSAKNLRGVQNVQRPADKRYLLEETANFNKMMKELKQVPDIPMAKMVKNPNNSLLRRLLPLSLLGMIGDSE